MKIHSTPKIYTTLFTILISMLTLQHVIAARAGAADTRPLNDCCYYGVTGNLRYFDPAAEMGGGEAAGAGAAAAAAAVVYGANYDYVTMTLENLKRFMAERPSLFPTGVRHLQIGCLGMTFYRGGDRHVCLSDRLPLPRAEGVSGITTMTIALEDLKNLMKEGLGAFPPAVKRLNLILAGNDPLTGRDISTDVGMYLAALNTRLEELNLMAPASVRQDGVRYGEPLYYKVETIAPTLAQLPDTLLRQFDLTAPSLLGIWVKDPVVGESSHKMALVQALVRQRRLTHLSLYSLRLAPDEHAALLDGLPNVPDLTYLNLGCAMEMGRPQLDGGVADGLARALAGRNSLRELCLYCIHIGSEGAARLAPALGGLTGLESLDLRDTELGDVGFAHLSPALAKLTDLRELVLGMDSVGPAGATALVPALGALSKLRSLILGNTNLGPEGLAALVPAFAGLVSLESFTVTDMNLKGEEAAAFFEGLPNLRALKFLNLHRTNLGDAGALKLWNVVPRLEVLKSAGRLELFGNNISRETQRIIWESNKLPWMGQLAFEDNRRI